MQKKSALGYNVLYKFLCGKYVFRGISLKKLYIKKLLSTEKSSEKLSSDGGTVRHAILTGPKMNLCKYSNIICRYL
jgi:hypothetical protein